MVQPCRVKSQMPIIQETMQNATFKIKPNDNTLSLGQHWGLAVFWIPAYVKPCHVVVQGKQAARLKWDQLSHPTRKNYEWLYSSLPPFFFCLLLIFNPFWLIFHLGTKCFLSSLWWLSLHCNTLKKKSSDKQHFNPAPQILSVLTLTSSSPSAGLQFSGSLYGPRFQL